MATLSTLYASTANAQDAAPRWGLGTAGVSIDRAYVDYERDNKIVPVLFFNNRWISLNGGTIDFKFNRSQDFSVRLRARYSLDGYDPDDSPFLDGMHDRDDSAWLGGALVWKPKFADVSLEVLADAMGNSSGTRARLGIEHRFAVGRFGLTPRIEAEWLDDRFVDYYYGVQADEALVQRPAYAGRASVNVEAGIRVDTTWRRRHTLFIDAGFQSLGTGIKDSPLVDRDTQSRLSIGYLYTF
jgi:outer membrane protein